MAQTRFTILVGPTGTYACPICLRGFSQSDIASLSEDHVPPKSVSRNFIIVLTCERCNQSGGSKVEGDMSRAERVRELIASDQFSDFDCKLKIKGGRSEVNARSSWIAAEKVTQITVGKRNNNPEKWEDSRSEFREAVDEQRLYEIDINLLRRGKVGPFDPARVAIAWLKAGYLAAFARFGYGYVTRESLKLVREQIKNPDQASMHDFYSYDPQGESNQDLVLMQDLNGKHGILARMGCHKILLPFENKDTGFYHRISIARARQMPLNFRGRSVGWPASPAYTFDDLDRRTEFSRQLREG